MTMKSIDRNSLYRTIKRSTGFHILLSLTVIFSIVMAPLAQTPIQKPGISLPPGVLVSVGRANAITKTKNLQLKLTATKLEDTATIGRISGTGTLKLTGNLTVASGCCARIKLEVIRLNLPAQGSSNFTTENFEFCGTKTVNILKTLNANQDDAFFVVKITNPDPWNKVTIDGPLTATFPTADVVLAAQPNVPIDLTRGVDVSRTFTLSPNTAGKLKVEIRWSGQATIQAKLFKPGQQVGAATNGVTTQSSSSGSIDLVYDIQPADITSGTQWGINVLNTSSASVTATGITFRVVYTIDE